MAIGPLSSKVQRRSNIHIMGRRYKQIKCDALLGSPNKAV